MRAIFGKGFHLSITCHMGARQLSSRRDSNCPVDPTSHINVRPALYTMMQPAPPRGVPTNGIVAAATTSSGEFYATQLSLQHIADIDPALGLSLRDRREILRVIKGWPLCNCRPHKVSEGGKAGRTWRHQITAYAVRPRRDCLWGAAGYGRPPTMGMIGPASLARVCSNPYKLDKIYLSSLSHDYYASCSSTLIATLYALGKSRRDGKFAINGIRAIVGPALAASVIGCIMATEAKLLFSLRPCLGKRLY